jgi:hypothetical protein
MTIRALPDCCDDVATKDTAAGAVGRALYLLDDVA